MKSFLIIFDIIGLCLSACVFELDSIVPFARPDLIFQRFEFHYGSSFMIEPKGKIYVAEDQEIEVFCYEKFKKISFPPLYPPNHGLYDYSNNYDDDLNKNNNPQNVFVKCKNSKLLYGPKRNSNNFDLNSIHSFECLNFKESMLLTPANIYNCDQTGFLYGFLLKNISIILAEFCYDIKKSNLLFSHYTALNRSPVFEDQEDYNPSNISLKLSGMQKFIFPHKTQILPVEQTITLSFFSGNVNFEFGKLIEFEKYVKLFEKFLGDTSEINSVLWWSNLKNGNWKLFETLIYKEAQRNDLDIYAGKSGIVTHPHDDQCNVMTELLIPVQNGFRNAPLLIWHYIKARKLSAGNTDVIVIGVNSPFFDPQSEKNNITTICKDVCDEIPWLKSLSTTRKMSTFGYMFCCKPDEIQNISEVLEGFPNLIVTNKPTNSSVQSQSESHLQSQSQPQEQHSVEGESSFDY